MTIKVAYDITLLGHYFNHFERKSGIFRVIEEVMYELLKREDIEITTIGLCSENLLISSSRAYSYFISNQDKLKKCDFQNFFKSKFELTELYQKFFFDITLTNQLLKAPKLDLRWILPRIIRKLLMSTKDWDIIAKINHENIDIFHSPYCQLPSEEVTGSLPRLLTVYDLIPITAPEFVVSKLTNEFKKTLDSISIQRDWITCISEHTKQEFCEYMKMSPERVFVTPLAAASHFYPVRDPERISEVCQRYSIPEGDYFLSIAAPQPRKNLVHLIHCFFRLLSEKPDLDINLVLVGSKNLGWMYDEIFALVESSTKYRSKIIFTGYVPDEELSEIYSGAKAFIFPSLYEGFGLPVLEAMQCGTPVISSNATSLPEVVGDAGILVAPRDEDALCQAMLDLLNNERLRKDLIVKGLERSQQFSWSKCAEELVRVYQVAKSN
jgi:glycosyltransferase involved in cell wall biosynthesis